MKKSFIHTSHLELIQSGDMYFSALLKLINNAVVELHLQVYIFEEDETGRKIIDALINAANRGVRVALVVDGYGSMGFSQEWIAQLKYNAVQFRFFSPMPFPGLLQAGRRLHHKICVADGHAALVGGINIGNKYAGIHQVAWLDYAVYLEGEICKQLQAVCVAVNRKKQIKWPILADKSTTVPLVRIRRNDWFRYKNEISASYKKQLSQAKQSVVIVASYFTPSRKLMRSILFAAKNCKKVELVLSHQSDIWLMKPAMKYLYRRLLNSGVEIYEYKKSVLHAKVCIIDNEWATIGSHNLNHLSEFLSIELNVEIIGTNFANHCLEKINQFIKNDCEKIDHANYLSNESRFNKMINYCSYKIMSILIGLLYLINRKKKVRKKH